MAVGNPQFCADDVDPPPRPGERLTFRGRFSERVQYVETVRRESR